MPLALTDSQLRDIMAAAKKLPQERRAEFIERFANLAQLHRVQADQLQDAAVIDLSEIGLSIDA
jgi:hypothetical protein